MNFPELSSFLNYLAFWLQGIYIYIFLLKLYLIHFYVFIFYFWVYHFYFSSLCVYGWLCLTLCDPVDHSPPGSSVHVIIQARILEWVAISYSRGSS